MQLEIPNGRSKNFEPFPQHELLFSAIYQSSQMATHRKKFGMFIQWPPDPYWSELLDCAWGCEQNSFSTPNVNSRCLSTSSKMVATRKKTGFSTISDIRPPQALQSYKTLLNRMNFFRYIGNFLPVVEILDFEIVRLQHPLKNVKLDTGGKSKVLCPDSHQS